MSDGMTAFPAEDRGRRQGMRTPDEVAAVLEVLWGGDETLIVISSDLSHYLPYRAAQAILAGTSRVVRWTGTNPDYVLRSLVRCALCGDAPTIRGQSSTADFFVDGVRDDAQYLRDLYNVERVEALAQLVGTLEAAPRNLVSVITNYSEKLKEA